MTSAIKLDTGTDLICGYFLTPDAPPTPVAFEEIGAAQQRSGGVLWLHFNLASARARDWLERQSGLDAFALEILLDANDDRTRLEPFDDGFVAVLSDMQYDFNFEPSEIGALRLFMDDRRIVSCRRHPLKAVDRLRKALNDHGRYASTAELMADLIEHLADTLSEVVSRAETDLDKVEDTILAERYQMARQRLGQLRQLVVKLRRHVSPQRVALSRLAASEVPWINDDDSARLRHAVEKFAGVLYDIEALQDRAKVLQDELLARVADQQNHSLHVLAVVTVIFTPMTLISGIFGMNVAGVPGVPGGIGGEHAFWWVMLLIMLSGLVMLLFLRPRK
ncbi:CorA family divalent cation transporter [Azospirillum picis]|uniref:Zinc transporter n=1 Tax=Azospirillum picis TaxID=488438 RepID=A0ABU0MVA2_9PROT|nr:CorA family divalent cation transporter [Azospirillum picis]MBP2303581.1 zinc transporter [Azospirillum picis]MDQ0537429.1 zinc transporter [Azospirillum picis]